MSARAHLHDHVRKLLKIVLVVVACRVVRGVGAGWRRDSIVDGVSGWGAAAPSTMGRRTGPWWGCVGFGSAAAWARGGVGRGGWGLSLDNVGVAGLRGSERTVTRLGLSLAGCRVVVLHGRSFLVSRDVSACHHNTCAELTDHS